MRLAPARLVPCLAGASWLWACGPAPCSEPASTSETAPRITELDLAGQLEGDPFTVILALALTDRDGDAGVGTLDLFLDGTRSDVSLSLFDLFRQSAVEATAAQAEISVPLRFSEDVSDGARVLLGVQVVDGAGQRSNCSSMTLDFALDAG